MEENGDWLSRLEEAAQAKAEFLEEHELPRLKKQFSLYQTYFDNIYGMLVRKSLVQENPYNYEEKITEVNAPSRDEIHEADKKDQMRVRLSAFRNQLEHLNNSYQFSLDFLDLSRIKRIVDLVNYIPWGNLTGSQGHSVSVILADFFRRISMSGDSMTAKVLRDTVNQATHTMHFILTVLKDLTNYQRERYKIHFRRAVLPQLKLQGTSPEDVVKAARLLFQRAVPGGVFYPELVREILAEETSTQGDQLKEDVINKLQVVKDEPRKPQTVSHKALLLQSIRLLASSGFQLQDVISKLQDNHEAMMTRRVGLVQRISRWLRKAFGKGKFDQIYEIEFVDNRSSTRTVEKIEFAQLMTELQSKAKLFSALSKDDSVATKQLKTASEKKLYDFLNRNLSSLQTVHRQLMGLNDHFKNSLQRERHLRHRGLRVELAAIKNSIVKCNQKKHEYVSAKEEQEQLAKLGVKTQ
jgi:hypothetical protein